MTSKPAPKSRSTITCSTGEQHDGGGCGGSIPQRGTPKNSPGATNPPKLRENLPSHFKFKEYCPQVFRNLRERFGVDDQDYQVCVGGALGGSPRLSPSSWPPVPSPCAPQVSLTRSPPRWAGSGRRLLLSADRTLVLKELSSEDVADVHGLLSHYHQVRGSRGARGRPRARLCHLCPLPSTWCSATGRRCCRASWACTG